MPKGKAPVKEKSDNRLLILGILFVIVILGLISFMAIIETPPHTDLKLEMALAEGCAQLWEIRNCSTDSVILSDSYKSGAQFFRDICPAKGFQSAAECAKFCGCP
jgi:hypothetical protein